MELVLPVPLRSTCRVYILVFFFNDTATTEIYTLSLHDALPIYHDQSDPHGGGSRRHRQVPQSGLGPTAPGPGDRKSTRLNSSHRTISYAVFCLKKKKKQIKLIHHYRDMNDIHKARTHYHEYKLK